MTNRTSVCVIRVLAAACIASLAGCGTTMNERGWMGQAENEGRGGVVHLDLLRADERPEAPLTNDGPSLVSLSRDNWRPVVFVVPVDGVASWRHYTTEVSFTDSTARQRGEHPTPLSSLELSEDTRLEQAAEGLVNPFNAFGDLVLLPARMAVRWPWREVYTFPPFYWRAPDYVLRRPVGGAVPADGPAGRPAERPEAPVEAGDPSR